MQGRSGSSSSVAAAALTAAILLAVGFATARAPRAATQDRPPIELFRGREVVAREVLIALRESADLASLRAELDTETDAPVGAGRLWRARSRSRNVSALLAQLASRGDVVYAEPNYIVYADIQPNDPRFPELWGLLNIGQTINGVPGTPGADISATTAWDHTLGSRNTVVGIVDTGIDYTHPDLAGNVWSAPRSYTVTVGGLTITCAAGTHGFNAISRSCDPFDDHFHGTHVSGTIGAVGNNGMGVAGINWYANMMGLKFLSASGTGTLSDAINAIEFAIQVKRAFPEGGANVRVLSNSWAGGGFSQALFDEVTRTNQSEMLFVAAAGNSASNNDTTPTYPASYAVPNVVAVAAITNQDALASFSNFGAASVHLGAPGVQVLSTVPGNAYRYLSGTSMATPHVSGSAALVLSHCDVSTAALKALLLNNVDQTAALSGITITGGRVNVDRAVEACGRTGNMSPTATLTNPSGITIFSAPANIVLSADAFDADGFVAQVAFYAGTALIGTGTAPPFQVTWTRAPVGDYSLTAVATDNDGATGTSAAVNIRVLPGPLPFNGVAASIPGIVEAENFNEGGEGVAYHDLTPGNTGGQYRQTDVDISTASDVGGGYALGWVNAGEWLAYTVMAGVTATYTIDARVASVGPGGTLHVEVDGTDATGPMAVPNTGSWQTWQTISQPGIQLTAGQHVLRVVIDSNGSSGYFGNLNYFRFTTPGINSPPSVQLTSPASGTIYSAPASVSLSATASDVDGTVTQVAFYAGSTLLGADTMPPYTFSWTSVPAGDYSLTAVATDDAGATTTSNAVTIHVVAPPPSTPFGGTPASIPGLIEAENFDDGGEGIAYHDSTPGNSGGQYRQTDVDIVAAADPGGFALGYVVAGEWLKYSVSVASTGSYGLDARVASLGAGGTFHVEVDGADATGPITVPNTGGWQSWLTISRPGISLTAGAHVLRVAIDTNGASGYLGNLNYLRWTVPGAPPPSSTPFGGTPAPIPGLIEAENFDDGGEGIAYHDLTPGNSGGQYRQTDVDISIATDVGGGYTLSYVSAGEWLKYSVSVAAAGTYSLDARVASLGVGGTFHVEVDGVDATGPLAVPNTGGWQSWQTISRPGVSLTAGAHVVRVVIDTNGAAGYLGNLNYLRWTAGGAAPPSSTPFGGTAAPIPGLIEAENFDDGGEGIAYHDLTPGNQGGQYRQTDVDITTAADVGGGYALGYVAAGEWLKYSVTVATTGSYTLEARVASLGAGGTFHVEVDGVDATGAIAVPNTGGWQSWQSISAPGISLTAGSHVLRLVIDTNGATGWWGNLNYLRWSASPPPTP
jgi:subtilisin family serine protease